MKLLDTDSPAGRAVELISDLVKQGRMSKAEARVIEELVWHPEFPENMRRKAKPIGARFGYRPDGTFDYSGCEGRTGPAAWQG